MEWLPPRQSCRTAVMKEQEEGGGRGMAQEVDTPAPAAVGAASVTTSRQRVS